MPTRPMRDLKDGPSCLHPSEAEIARLVLGKNSAMWDAIAEGLESRGLPPIDHVFGGRYWPAVIEFLNKRNRIGQSAAEIVRETRRRG